MAKKDQSKKTIKYYDEFYELETLREKEESLDPIKDKKDLEKVKREIKILRDYLISENLYIAEILAKKYTNRGIEFDDLFQIASLGLVLAVDRFTTERGFEFSSFATPTITGEIKRYFRDKGWVIRVPRRIQELSKRINDSKVDLAQRLQRSPTIDEIAEYLDVTTEEVLETMDASQVYSPQSIDQNLDNSSDDGEINLRDLLGQEDSNYELVDNLDYIKDAMKDFSEVERKIVVYRYFDKMTQGAIADELDISQMTVSRLEKKVLKKFRIALGIDVKQKK